MNQNEQHPDKTIVRRCNPSTSCLNYKSTGKPFGHCKKLNIACLEYNANECKYVQKRNKYGTDGK